MSTPSGDFTPEDKDPFADAPPPQPLPTQDLPGPPPPPGASPAAGPHATPPGYHSGSAQQPGGQPPVYPGQPGAYPYPPRPYYPKTWMNIVALVTGLMCFGPLAAIFGHLGVNAANRGEAEYKGMGTAGLILGYAGLAFWVLYFGFFIVLAASGF